MPSNFTNLNATDMYSLVLWFSKYCVVCVYVFKYLLILERKGERDGDTHTHTQRNRETLICSSTKLCIHWLILELTSYFLLLRLKFYSGLFFFSYPSSIQRHPNGLRSKHIHYLTISHHLQCFYHAPIFQPQHRSHSKMEIRARDTSAHNFPVIHSAHSKGQCL